MPLAVDVIELERSPLPVVRLIVSGVPAGRAWRVMGEAGPGQEWVAGEGVSTGTDVVFADPWAPLGTEASYVLRYTSSAAPADIDDLGFGFLDFGEGPFGGSLVAVRRYAGRSVLTDLTGRTLVDFLWTKAGGDVRQWEPRGEFLEVPGDAFGTGVYASVAGAGTGKLLGRTVMPHTATLRGLVRANRPLVLLHQHVQPDCTARGCDVQLSQTVFFTAVTEDLSPRDDRAERDWTLTYRHVARPHRFLAPVVTWEDVRSWFASLGELTGAGMTAAQLARGDWAVAP